MDRNTIIDGLRMTMDLCVFDPSTGEEIEPHLLNDISRATYDACKGALEILEQLPPAQPEPHWIPVTERLPEKDGRYLVCGQKGGIYHANYRGRWWTQVGCGGKLVPSVVAWCELPEPWKGEATE